MKTAISQSALLPTRGQQALGDCVRTSLLLPYTVRFAGHMLLSLPLLGLPGLTDCTKHAARFPAEFTYHRPAR